MTARSDVELPALVPLAAAVGEGLEAGPYRLTRLPFRVGRDLRSPNHHRARWFRERRRGGTGPNDLYLVESGSPLRISREHFLIGLDPETGRFFLQDRASSCGTLVGGARLGGNRRGGRAELRHGDVIRPGGEHSPFAFRFVLPGGQNGSVREEGVTSPAAGPQAPR